MATTFTWEILGIKRVLADGGVLQASFTLKAKDSKDGQDFEVRKKFSIKIWNFIMYDLICYSCCDIFWNSFSTRKLPR